MSELKTLKDFTTWNPKPLRRYFDEKTQIMTSKPFETIDKEELKAEAVKWVKCYQSQNIMKEEYNFAIEFIKHFFNLTEEDLK